MTGAAALHPGDRPATGGGSDAAEPDRVDRAARWVFVALVAVALPLLLLHFGRDHWFSGDEWTTVVGSADGWPPDLLEPHGGAHWIAVPRLVYWGLWRVAGVNSYWPYQLVIIAMHLTVAVLLRAVMCRSGVRPVLASAAAAVFVVAGAGASNSLWAFQVSFVGSIMWGLAHLLVADHPGPARGRDLLGLAFGLLALTSSGVGVTTTLAVGTALLLRRGWRSALLHTLPLALVYLAWMTTRSVEVSGPFGRPTVRVLAQWVQDSVAAGFEGVGHFALGGWLLLALLVAGAIVLWTTPRQPGDVPLRHRLAMPLGLAVGALFFAATTGTVRAWLGAAEARSDRYVYLQAALWLPLLAVAADALARRWRALTPVLVVAFLLPVPFNLAAFDDSRDPAVDAMRDQRYILTTAVRMPFADDVPPDVAPIPRPFYRAATIGFLLRAEADGKLTPSTAPLTPESVNEFRVRLGVADRGTRGRPTGCREVPAPVDLDPARGEDLQLGEPVAITTQRDGQPTSRPVPFRSNGRAGVELAIELADLHLRLVPADGTDTVTLCTGREQVDRVGPAVP